MKTLKTLIPDLNKLSNQVSHELVKLAGVKMLQKRYQRLTINANDHNRTTTIKFSKILKSHENLKDGVSRLSKKFPALIQIRLVWS